MTHQLNPDWRNRRNHKLANFHKNLGPMHYSIASYCTETSQPSAMEKNPSLLGPEVCLEPLHMLSNPLQKNLGDSLPLQKPVTVNKSPQIINTGNSVDNFANIAVPGIENPYSALSSIGNFISGVFNVISAVVPTMPFQRRARSSDDIHDRQDLNFEACLRGESASPDFWLPAKSEPQNKNNCNDQSDVLVRENNVNGVENEEMSVDCRTAAAHCEAKLNKVRNLLIQPEKKTTPRLVARRPKKVFVEPNSISNGEETFCSDDIVHLPNNTHVECVSMCNNTEPELVQIDSPLTKTELDHVECTYIVKTISDKNAEILGATEVSKPDVPVNSDKQTNPLPEPETSAPPCLIEDVDPKCQIIQTCEDKVSKLKALLQQRRKNNTKLCPNLADPAKKSNDDEKCNNQKTTIVKVHNNKFKNRSQLKVDRRKKPQSHQNVADDMNFGNEIDLNSSVDSSPSISISTHCASQASLNESSENLSSGSECYFNEIAGRFRKSSTTESEDSFQIVFADQSQPTPRARKSSDCDSEDSFIVFEDSPDSCYISTDVFGDQASDESDDESSDEDNVDSGNGQCILSNSFSRTVGDLTDDSLYGDSAPSQSVPYSDSEDEVDCALNVCEDNVNNGNKGMLLNEARKLAKKAQPAKKVHFSEDPPKVRVMRVWAFAARQARAGHWEQHAIDRERFKRRIADADMAISWVLKPQHRSRVKFQRFMPWWHAQRRQEAAEKKARAEEAKRLEEQRLKQEAEDRALEEERLKKEEEEKAIEEERLKREEEERIRIEAEKVEASKLEGNPTNCVQNGEVDNQSVAKECRFSKDPKQVEIIIKDKFYLTPNAKCVMKSHKPIVKSNNLTMIPIVHINNFSKAKTVQLKNAQNAALTLAHKNEIVKPNSIKHDHLDKSKERQSKS